MADLSAVACSKSTAEATLEKLPRPDAVLPIGTKLAYAIGGSTDVFGHWLYNSLVDPVYNVFLGLSPTQVSITRAATLALDGCSGLLFGWLSDNTRSRWGRRRPYVLVGSIAAGLGLPLLFMARPSWSSTQVFTFMLVSSVVYAPMIAAYNMPYQSLGAELTPDYNERTSVMSYKGLIQKTAGALIGWALWFANRPMFHDPATGKPDVARGAVWAAVIAGVWMILSGIINFVFVKERYYGQALGQRRNSFVRTFREAFTCQPYLVLLGVTCAYLVSNSLSGTFQFYALNFYVLKGDMVRTSEIAGWSSNASLVCGLAGIYVVNWISRVSGKQKALSIALLTDLIAFAGSWWTFTPKLPLLSVISSGLNGFSAAGVWVLLQSMFADVIDYDELQNNQRREGSYSASFSAVMTFGTMVSILLGGLLLQATGFGAALGGDQSPQTIVWIRMLYAGIPAIALSLGLTLVKFYPLSTERMRYIRTQLEQRRGAV